MLLLLQRARQGLQAVAVPTYVDGDVSRVYASLDFSHFGVLPPAPEQPWGLHPEVAHLQEA